MNTTALEYETFTRFSPHSDLGQYRAADYWRLPEGEPVELLRGRLTLTPSRTTSHQIVVMQLCVLLLEIARTSRGFGVAGPLDCVLSDDTIAQPDLLYVSRQRFAIVRDRVEGPPDLVVEVVELDTARRDRVEKLDLYARHAVAEYWIVDPQTQLIEFLINENGRFVVQSPANDRYQSPRLPEVEIQLANFWREVQQRLPQV